MKLRKLDGREQAEYRELVRDMFWEAIVFFVIGPVIWLLSTLFLHKGGFIMMIIWLCLGVFGLGTGFHKMWLFYSVKNDPCNRANNLDNKSDNDQDNTHTC